MKSVLLTLLYLVYVCCAIPTIVGKSGFANKSNTGRDVNAENVATPISAIQLEALPSSVPSKPTETLKETKIVDKLSETIVEITPTTKSYDTSITRPPTLAASDIIPITEATSHWNIIPTIERPPDLCGETIRKNKYSALLSAVRETTSTQDLNSSDFCQNY